MSWSVSSATRSPKWLILEERTSVWGINNSHVDAVLINTFYLKELEREGSTVRLYLGDNGYVVYSADSEADALALIKALVGE